MTYNPFVDPVNGSLYEDLQGSLALAGLPAANPARVTPYDYNSAGAISVYPVLAFDNSWGENAFFVFQSNHSMELSSVLELHAHIVLPTAPTGTDKIAFEVEVIAAPIGGTFAEVAGSPFTSADFSVDTAHKHYYMDLCNIPAVNTTVSTIYHLNVKRVQESATTDDYAPDVYVLSIDCHQQCDALGSRQEESKE